MTTTISAADLPGRLARLYEGGRYREALEETSRLEWPAAAEASGDVELAVALQLTGCAHRELNDLPAAESRLLEAQRLLGAPEGPSRPAYLRGLAELARLYEQMGGYDQAESLYRRALDLHARGTVTDPEGQARCLHALADLYDLLHRRRDAVEALRQAREVRASHLGTGHPEFARGLLVEAWVGFRVGKSLATEDQARKALEILRAAYAEGHPRYAEALYKAGRILLPLGHLDEAERLLTQACDIRRAALGETHPEFAATIEGLALVKLARCQPREAEALARRALDVTRAAVGEGRLELAWRFRTLGNALAAGGNLAEAEECQRQAHDTAQSALGEQHPAAAEMLGDLAETLLQVGRPRDAAEVLRQALARLEQAGPDAAFERIDARLRLGRFLLGQGRCEEAAGLAGVARQEADSLGADDPFVTARACVLRAHTLAGAGRLAPAGEELRRAEAVVKPLVPHHGLTIEVAYARMELFLRLGDLPSAVRLGNDTALRVARALGEAHPAHPPLLRYVASLRHQAGEFEEAEALFERALALSRRHYGPEHVEVADTLRGLARLYLSRDNLPAAETRLRQACDIRRAVLGEQHPGYAVGLADLAGLHHQTGNFLAADLYYRQALEILRANPGEDHPDYAVTLHGRAVVLHALGEVAEAERLLEQALRTLRADSADPDPRGPGVRHSLALLHASRSDFLCAEDLLKRTVEGYERAAGPDHTALVPVLTDLGRTYEAMGDLAACGPVLDRIRAINARAHGETSLPHAFDLVAAANLARLQGDGDRAEAQARRALAVARAVLPDGHPGLVEFLGPLAQVCQARHKSGEAEKLLGQALALTVGAFGPRHPGVAHRQSDVGALFAVTGRPDEAARRFESAAELLRAALGEDHPEHAAARRVLGQHYHAQGKYAEAERAWRTALAVTRRTAGENHPAVAECLQNLAELGRARKDLSGAADHYRQALEVLRQGEAPADALHAALLHGQALTLLQQGCPQGAEPLLRAALDIDQAAGDEATPRHLDSVVTLGQLYAAGGRDEEAALPLRVALESGLRLAPGFCCLDHTGPPAPFWTRLWDLCEMLLTLAVRTGVSAPAARSLFDAVLRVKGLGPKGMVLAERDGLFRRHPGLRAQLETRFVLGRQSAGRVATGGGPEGSEAHRRLLARWDEQRERQEQELEGQVPELAQQRRWLTLDTRAVAAALPPESALIEYVRYQLRDFAGLCAGTEEKGPARYLAFVVHAGRPDDVRLVPLGEAAPVERLARAACSLRRRHRSRESLTGLIITPLASELEGCRSVIIAASGPLARLRFVELPGGLAVQRQMTSARELLGLPAALGTEGGDHWMTRLLKLLRGRG